MMGTSGIREHMAVVGADGGHVGTVDKVEGDRIKLTKQGPGADGQHHWMPLSMVADVEADVVRLSMTAELAPQFWQSEGGGTVAEDARSAFGSSLPTTG